MSPPTTGYSGTPLAKKLSIAANSRILARHAPDGYREWLAPLPDGVRFVSKLALDVDVVHVFVMERAKLAKELSGLRAAIRPDAVLWVSWPKKASRVATDITEDSVRELALPLGFVDVKVCAVSEVWSGLKLVVRKSQR